MEAEPVNRIRVETALSRFPIHRLAKKNTIAIRLEQTDENGDIDFKWEVGFNETHGQPGPLAYKIDTLIVNRRLDESGRPLPGVVRLGSLTEICAAMGIGDSGENRANVKKALHQNASAYITARFQYRTRTGKQKWSEIGYTRYSVIFTGEILPDGRTADAVYIVPNPSYRDLLDHVEVRPLDYDYLTLLAPGPQRFYELLSFQMYGAIASGRARAKLLYSEYCQNAPQVRYAAFEQVKKQMYKIHAPHREAGYIVKVDYQQTTDAVGAPDWEMLYTAGPKAVGEYNAFTRRQVHRKIEQLSLPSLAAASDLVAADVDRSMLDELTRRGISLKKAKELLDNLKPGQPVVDQLGYVDQLISNDKRCRLENPPGLYVTYVRDNIRPPDNFQGIDRKEVLQRDGERRQADKALAASKKAEYDAFCAAETDRYIESIARTDQYELLFETHARQNRSLLSDLTPDELESLTRGTVASELRYSGRIKLPSFEEFVRTS